MLTCQGKGNANKIMISETKLDNTGLYLSLFVKTYYEDLFL